MDKAVLDDLRAALEGLGDDQGGAGAFQALPSLARLSERDMVFEIDLVATRTIGAPVVIAHRNGDPDALAALTPRQREVAVFIGQGLSNAQIAAMLGISVATVKDHVHAMLDRLGLSSRHQIIALIHGGTLAVGAGDGNPSSDG